MSEDRTNCRTPHGYACGCQQWARACLSPYDGVGKYGWPLVTNHHPNCEHYEDSLIDVWKVNFEGDYYYTDREPESLEDGETVTKTMMHMEVYEQLPEHPGF